MLRFAGVALLTLLFTACFTSPQARYYGLREPAVAAVPKTGSAVVLFGPFDIAQYLRRPQSSSEMPITSCACASSIAGRVAAGGCGAVAGKRS